MDDARAAYVDGLRMLARRELSEVQVRQRLRRRGHKDEEIDVAVARLKLERALDDTRVAEAIARTEAGVRGRGRLRATRRMQSAGISPAIARRAADQVYGDLDPDAMLTAAIGKRLRGRTQVKDERELARLYRYLIGQGFEPDRVSAALRRLSRGSDEPD